MKKAYLKPALSVVKFSAKDVMQDSGFGDGFGKLTNEIEQSWDAFWGKTRKFME